MGESGENIKMRTILGKEELVLLQCLKYALEGTECGNICLSNSNINWEKMISVAEKHAVLSLLYGVLDDVKLPQNISGQLNEASRHAAAQSYRLLFLTKYVVGILSENGIPAVVLKGVSAAASYPIPELRKSGDVDVLVGSRVSQKKLDEIMTGAHFDLFFEQHSAHHTVYTSPEGIKIELHRTVMESLDYKQVDQAVDRQMEVCMQHVIKSDIMGVRLPVFDRPYQAFHLLLHMLQHFMRAGFGLKLLCDWVGLWKEDWKEDEKLVFWQMVKDTHICGFARTITGVCEAYLGLPKENTAFMEGSTEKADFFLQEIFQAEEFGHSNVKRMVMLHGSTPADYLREFHHQMHLNYPVCGKWIILWPFLWLFTLIRFLYNNKKVRHISLNTVLKAAKQRSMLMEEIQIFDE